MRWLVRWAIEGPALSTVCTMELSQKKFSKPAVVIVNKGFVADAKSAAASKGMPGVRIVSSPVMANCTILEDIDAGITSVMQEYRRWINQTVNGRGEIAAVQEGGNLGDCFQGQREGGEPLFLQARLDGRIAGHAAH